MQPVRGKLLRRTSPAQRRVGRVQRREESNEPARGKLLVLVVPIIQKKNKEKEKGKGKEERREKRKKERGEFNLEDPMFLFNFHSFFQKIIK